MPPRPPIQPLLSSGSSESFRREFESAGDRAEIEGVIELVLKQLDVLGLSERHRAFVEVGRAEKKNYAQRLSTALAQKFADALRPKFKTILPTVDGRRQESRSMGAGGLKKLDVNHSTPEIGLGLGVSIKTINFLDIKTRRYTKNIKRVDGELRAEAQDYHRRQPFSVLAAVIFMPRDSAEDGAGEKSSLRHAWEVFRGRAGRNSSDDPHERFERLWIGLYETGTEQLGEIRFFEAGVEAPLRGAPSETVGFGDVIAEITATFEGRNRK